jgi:hypothetical protein
VLLDGVLARRSRDFNPTAPHKYKAVKHPVVAGRLMTSIHPSL